MKTLILLTLAAASSLSTYAGGYHHHHWSHRGPSVSFYYGWTPSYRHSFGYYPTWRPYTYTPGYTYDLSYGDYYTRPNYATTGTLLGARQAD